MSVIGGPREVSMPWPLNEAGGRLEPGERASLGPAGGGGAEVVMGGGADGGTYDDEVAVVAVVADDSDWAEGFVARLEREVVAAETVELIEGRRSRVGGSGAVWVRWCLGGEGSLESREDLCRDDEPPLESLDDFRKWGMAAASVGKDRVQRSSHLLVRKTRVMAGCYKARNCALSSLFMFRIVQEKSARAAAPVSPMMLGLDGFLTTAPKAWPNHGRATTTTPLLCCTSCHNSSPPNDLCQRRRPMPITEAVHQA